MPELLECEHEYVKNVCSKCGAKKSVGDHIDTFFDTVFDGLSTGINFITVKIGSGLDAIESGVDKLNTRLNIADSNMDVVGNNVSDKIQNVDLDTKVETVVGSVKTTSQTIAGKVMNIVRKTPVYDVAKDVVVGVGTVASETVEDLIVKFSNNLGEASNIVMDELSSIVSELGDAAGGVMGNILKTVNNNLQAYKDGISETSFGASMEDSWHGNSNSFLNYFSANYGKLDIAQTTPLDPGNGSTSLYGTMMLGCPFTFNEFSDPGNRALINTIIKDSKFLSLTPGKPKYNGLTSYTGSGENNIRNLTKNGDEMLKYLLRNGLDASFTEKDKRYYTFQADYSDYFAYLETMLNTIWIKLGLAKNGDKFDIFSFFDIKKNGRLDTNGQLKPQYNSSIGFFTNPAGSIAESIDTSMTSFGSDLAGRVNNASNEMQNLNYITGMGTAGGIKEASRRVGLGLGVVKNVKDLLGSTFSNTIGAIGDAKYSSTAQIIKSVASIAIGLGKDIVEFNNTQDLGNVIQQFSVSNGMKVVYPELWSDSTYSKSMNFNFSFVSPYGDPLSIFRYVYVPFCALACFALPRQADENGYVSPFLVRADVPGIITSDLALISSFSWIKGGSSNLWTKDSLPRAIDCSITISDLYPYLSMTKRLSFLSANPSYTVFLDNMTGMCALTDQSDDGLNEYFKAVINRVNGTETSRNSLWNKFNYTKSNINSQINEFTRPSVSGKLSNIPWVHNTLL